MADKPNFIIIMPDQHRADILGCAGTPVKTPNLDRLALEGIRFTNAITQSPLCVPTRASMLTGRYVHETEVYGNHVFLHETHPGMIKTSFLNILKENGYETVDVGKMHYVRHKAGHGKRIEGKDFSQLDHVKNQVSKMKEIGFTEVQEVSGKMGSFSVGSIYTDALKENNLLDKLKQHIAKFPMIYSDPMPLPEEFYIDSFVGNLAIKWLENYANNNDSKKSFCLFMGFPGPHDPFDCIKEYRDLYNPEDIELNEEELKEPKRPFPFYVTLSRSISRSKFITKEYIQKCRAAYFANVTLIDKKIGQLRDVLEKAGLLENTWIIYTSDHGEQLGDHKLFMKFVFYRSSVNVPLIIRPPNGMKGKIIEQDVELIDIPATIFDILNIKLPPNHRGKSLMPFVNKDTLIEKYQHKEFCLSQVGGYAMGATNKWKFVVDVATGKLLELYDRNNDYYENNNLAKTLEGKEIGAKLYHEYLEKIIPKVKIDKNFLIRKNEKL